MKFNDAALVNAITGKHILQDTVWNGIQNLWIEVLMMQYLYYQNSNISHTWEGNKTVDHSDVVGALLVSAAPTISSFLT